MQQENRRQKTFLHRIVELNSIVGDDLLNFKAYFYAELVSNGSLLNKTLSIKRKHFSAYISSRNTKFSKQLNFGDKLQIEKTWKGLQRLQ